MSRNILTVAWAGVLMVALVFSLTVAFMQINARGVHMFEIVVK